MSAKGLFLAIFNNEANYVFWFFYCIFAVYMCLPLFSLAADKKNIKTIEYVCVLGFVFNSVLPLVNRFVIPVYGGLTPVIRTGYVVFVFMGWLIKNKDYTKKARILIFLHVGYFRKPPMFFGIYCQQKRRGNRHFVYGLYVDSLPAYVRRRVYGRL